MFAVLALICFVLKLFHVSFGTVDLVVLGLCFLAAHLAFAWTVPWPWRRDQP